MTTTNITDVPILRGPVALSHLAIRHFLREGDLAVDATCGNGHDTLLLAETVGASGRVWAFDIQELAIQKTSCRLAEAGLAERVELMLCGHETLVEHVSNGLGGVIFNLGYLPGSDRTIATRPETTLAAFGQSLELLRPGGILSVAIYPGHDGGASERRTVDGWAASLSPQAFHSWRMGQLNVPTDAPYFILIQKTA